jgi:hypothetical protein
VLTRLQTSLPSALWDLDKAKVDNIVAAEMMPPELVSIRVYDTSVGLFSGKLRNENGTITSIENDAAVAARRWWPTWPIAIPARPALRSSR